MTDTLAAISLTALGLIVGLIGSALAWVAL